MDHSNSISMNHTRTSPRIKSFNFKCTVCKMSFARSSTLKVHQKTHEKASTSKPSRRNDKIITPEFIDETDDDDNDDQNRDDHKIQKPKKRTLKPIILRSTRLKLKREKIDLGDKESIKIANDYNETEDIKYEYDSSSNSQLNNHQNVNVLEKINFDPLIIMNKLKPFKCQFCPKFYLDEDQLKAHLQSDHNHKNKSGKGKSPRRAIQKNHQNGKFKNCDKNENKKGKRIRLKRSKNACSYCNRTFINPGHLVTHIRTHTKEKPFKCEICERSFARNDTLRIHQKTHKKTFNCFNCPKVFNVREKLNEHVDQVHSDTKPYKCSFCSQRYTTSQNRGRHERFVHLGKRYQCTLCDNSFARNDSLGIHNRKYHGLQSESSVRVPAIKKAPKFPKSSNKRNDQNSTSGSPHFDDDGQDANENKYKCPHCDESFRKRKRLKKHIDRTHLGEESPYGVEVISADFSCSICSENFLNETSLSEHIQEHYNYEVNYICELCQESFKKRKRLQKHIRNFHLVVKSSQSQSTQKSKGTVSPARPGISKRAKSQLKPLKNDILNLFFCPMCPIKFSEHEALIKHSSKHRDFFLNL